MEISPNIKLLIFFALMILFLRFFLVPTLESTASDNFNKTFEKLKQNAELTFKYIDMNKNDKTIYLNNSCDIVFNNSIYRGGDAELCKLKMKS